jgi:hypothetical protein
MKWSFARSLVAVPLALGLFAFGSTARGDDLANLVARARDQVESGGYEAALKTLSYLPSSNVPPALAVEAALLETTAALVARGPSAGEAACSKAIIAAGYDPEVARDQSPKVRSACRAAAATVRGERIQRDRISFAELVIEAPEVAYRPVRIEVVVSVQPIWLRAVARITSTALDGSFDLALAPSVEGPLRGTLDASWIRPGAKIHIDLVAQDKYGDLGGTLKKASFDVPRSEAAIALGTIPTGATVTVDGTATKLDAQGRAPVAPGTHTIALELTDGATASTSIEVKRGNVARVALSPQKAASSRTFAWIATGTTVALGAVGTVLFLTANGRKGQIEDAAAKREPSTSLPATEYSDIASLDKDRKTFVTAGTAVFIAGGVTGALAVALWLWPDSRPNTKKRTGRPEVAPRARSAQNAPRAIVPVFGIGGVGVAGSF